MKIYLKNTLTGELDKFKPLKRKKVSMYHCGPTVYNKAHIGNISSYIFADILRKVFEVNGYTVKQVINITDVGHLTDDGDLGEDKVEKEARSRGLKAKDITKKYTEMFLDDLKDLNIDVSKIEFPKATEYIDKQIDLIKEIEKKGYTYKTSDGIYFDTSKFDEYGMLGNINIEGLKEGARVVVNDEKKNNTDFALWKFSDLNEKRQQEWDSPWGVGFPGWHLECSAMSHDILGDQFDIHTGGIDHINTHHNNEIAQSTIGYGKLPAKYWLHANHIMLNGEKISKSTGNVIYLDEVKKY
jgi:cysteinyl-tRNA synthetase